MLLTVCASVASICLLSSGELVTAAEDRTVKVWAQDGSLVQTIEYSGIPHHAMLLVTTSLPCDRLPLPLTTIHLIPCLAGIVLSIRALPNGMTYSMCDPFTIRSHTILFYCSSGDIVLGGNDKCARIFTRDAKVSVGSAIVFDHAGCRWPY